MIEIFRIKFAKSMIASFTIQQILTAASSWALVDFIRETASPKDFRISKIAVLIVIAVSPYIPGFFANYFFHLWSAFGRTANIHSFMNLISSQRMWAFNTKQRDEIFALQREHLGLLEESGRCFFLNFPVVLNLVFNSIAIGFLLGTDIIIGMLAGLFISTLQFILVPFFTENAQKQKQENHYQAEKSLLGFWQVLTLKNQPFFRNSLETISSYTHKSESLSERIFNVELVTNIFFLIASFCPLTWILMNTFKEGQPNQIFLMSLGVLLPRILQIFNMSSNLILAGQSFQTLRIKWKSFQGRLETAKIDGRFTQTPSEKPIFIIDVQTGEQTSLDHALTPSKHGRYLIKGANGSGKSTLCLNIKADNSDIFYLPAKFENPQFNAPGSTGELKLSELKWLYENRWNYSMIILDEWDANLDSEATTLGDSLIQEIATTCLVFEVRHKDFQTILSRSSISN